MFADRADAGRQLGQRLQHLRGPAVVVLGLPRGGVEVAAEVAAALVVPLDVIMVRKLGVPSQPELAMGAMLFAIAVGIPLGFMAAKRYGSWIDSSSLVGSLIGAIVVGLIIYSVKVSALKIPGEKATDVSIVLYAIPGALIDHGGNLWATGSTKNGADTDAWLARSDANGDAVQYRTFDMRGNAVAATLWMVT